MYISPDNIRKVVRQYISSRRTDDNVPDNILNLWEKIQKNPNELTPNQVKIVLSLSKRLDEKDYSTSSRSIDANKDLQDQNN